jgi:ATP-dependent helicase/nuclease subunit A
MTVLPLDQEAREQALDPRRSFHLEAPAGSGKTSVLLARFLTLLARVDAPEELLALTFTRKAAGELRTRVMQLLRAGAELKPDASPMDRRLVDLAQEVFRHFSRKQVPLQEILAPERLPVMTFHGFCARLLALAPQEAGLSLEFRLVEGQDAEWLKQDALEELRRRLAARPASDPARRALVSRLVRLNNNWPRLTGELRTLLDRRDTLQDFLALVRESRDPGSYATLMTSRLAAALASDLAALAGGLAASDLGRAWPEFWRYLHDHQAPLAAALPPEPPGAELADLPVWQRLAQAILTQKGGVRKRFGQGDGFPPRFSGGVWDEALRALPPRFFDLLARYRDLPPEPVFTGEVTGLQDLLLLLWEALAVYGELCRRQGVLDFIDLEMAALKLLAAESLSGLLSLLDWRLQHLLVDEFQDTSENQKILLCRLLSGWEAELGRTLTVVGDPKQSIYGWRRAKLSLFLEARRGLRCESDFTFPLESLSLTTNFRASRRLINWVNQVFGDTVMAPGREAEGLVFQAASPAPAAPEGEAPHLALFVDDDKPAARQTEARWLARRLMQALQEQPAGDTIGVLLFARTHLKAYLEALQEAGLSVRVREGLKLADSRAVQHLHNLARALVRPHDDLAWAGLLAGPWGPQSLAAVAQAALAQGSLWSEKLRSWTETAACPPPVQQCTAALLQAQQQTGRRPLHEIIRDFLLAADAWTGIAAWEGPPGVANARMYLELLARAESGLPETTYQKADFHLAEAYQPPDPRAQDSPIELMTVHGAKGLEFDRVFLPYLDWQPLAKGGRTPPPFLLEEIPGAAYGLALAPPYEQKTPSLLYRSLKNLQDRRVLAEARRVFYVAATRARKQLFLSGVCGLAGDGAPRVPAQSPLGWLWEHYQPGFLPFEQPVVLPDPELRVELFEGLPETDRLPAALVDLPEPLRFAPEPAPYVLVFPSQLVKDERLAPDPAFAPEDGSDAALTEPLPAAADLVARLRGEVMHRLLETAALGKALPAAPGVAAALRHGGLEPETAALLAPEILAEAEACLGDPFLARLLSPALPKSQSEWRLEDAPGEGLIRRGQIDRLAHDGKDWWLVDYKTSRPPEGGDWQAFATAEAAKYRPQLLAYRDMAAKALGLAPEAVRAALYFTACRQVVEIVASDQ